MQRRLRSIFKDKRYVFLFLIIIFLITRIPFLDLGFGLDGDSWLVANTAHDISTQLDYHPSRVPGYPLFEFLESIFISYGPIGTNTLVMLFSLGAVLVFSEFCYTIKVKNPALLSITFCLFPFIWINSMNTMDYMVALFFILLTFLLAWKDKSFFAGISLGLAVGCRFTSGIFIIPLLYWIYKNKSLRKSAIFLLTSIVTSIIVFTPVIFKYGFSYVITGPAQVAFSAYDIILRTGYLTLIFFGVIPTLFFLIYLLLDISKIKKNIVLYFNKNGPEMIAFLLAILSIFGLFVILPNQPSYLLPIFPFCLLFLSKISRKKMITVFCVLLVVSGFVRLSIYKPDLIECGHKFSFDISEGSVVQTIDHRKNQLDELKRLFTMNESDCVILVDEIPTGLWYYQEKWDTDLKHIENTGFFGLYFDDLRNIIIGGYANKSAVDHYIGEGYRIYYSPLSNWHNHGKYGYKLSDMKNSTRLKIKNALYFFLS